MRPDPTTGPTRTRKRATQRTRAPRAQTARTARAMQRAQAAAPARVERIPPATPRTTVQRRTEPPDGREGHPGGRGPLFTARAILATMRPRQWVKNLFVLAPLVFSKNLTDFTLAGRAAIAVAAFCLLSGAVYAFNDVRDVEGDRRHPSKRRRPIAAGR